MDSGSPYVRSILRAGESEVPDESKLASLALKLGPILGGGGGGAGGGGAIAAKTGAAAKTASVGAALKLAGGAVLAATLGVSSAVYVPKMIAAPTRSDSTGIAISSSTATAVTTKLPAPVEMVAPVESIAPPAARRPAAVIESPDAEVKLLERAQDALRTRPEKALVLCTEHAGRFPQGLLTQEREVIAIEALTQTGRLPEAQSRAGRFAANYSNSTHLRRVEALVGKKF